MMADGTKIYLMAIESLQPSQLYISREKLTQVQSHYDYSNPTGISPIPIKRLDGLQVMTDGHTRALAAYLAGLPAVPTFPDPDDLDWDAYRICVAWCHDAQIFSVADLAEKVISPQDYERLWYDRCRVMQSELAERRRNSDHQEP